MLDKRRTRVTFKKMKENSSDMQIDKSGFRYHQHQQSRDLNPDYYLRRPVRDMCLPPASTNQRTAAGDVQLWRHRPWRYLGHNLFVRRPSSSVAIATAMYTSVILVSSLVSKADKDAKEALRGQSNVAEEGRRIHMPGESLPCTTETFTVTSAILDSCLYPWPFCWLRSTPALVGTILDKEPRSILPEGPQTNKSHTGSEDQAACRRSPMAQMDALKPCSDAETSRHRSQFSTSDKYQNPADEKARQKNRSANFCTTLNLLSGTQNTNVETEEAPGATLADEQKRRVQETDLDSPLITVHKRSHQGPLQAYSSDPMKTPIFSAVRGSSQQDARKDADLDLRRRTSAGFAMQFTERGREFQPVVGRLSKQESSPSRASQEVALEDTGFVAKQVFPVQLLSLLLLPELCV